MNSYRVSIYYSFGTYCKYPFFLRNLQVCNVQCTAQTGKCYITVSALMQCHLNSGLLHITMGILMLAPKGVIKLYSK